MTMIPLVADINKSWHHSVTEDLRIHLIRKLVVGVLPELMHSNAALPDNDKLGPAMEFAKSEEKKMFEIAESRAEYYGLIAAKIYQSQENRETLSAPPMPQNPKAWQMCITEDLRQHLILKIKTSLDSYYRDEDASLQVAKKVEQTCYETADTRSEFYHLIGEKLYQMQRAMETFKLRKQNEATSSASAQPPQTDEMESELMEISPAEKYRKEIQEMLEDFKKHKISDT